MYTFICVCRQWVCVHVVVLLVLRNAWSTLGYHILLFSWCLAVVWLSHGPYFCLFSLCMAVFWLSHGLCVVVSVVLASVFSMSWSILHCFGCACQSFGYLMVDVLLFPSHLSVI